MCGIFGYISLDKKPLTDGLKNINHRGPDHSGEYYTTINNYHIGLGHTRLSILDLSPNGNQPMLSNDKQSVVAYNGEIYNFNELKNTYLGNIPLRSTGDTEVLLNLLDIQSKKAIELLNGDFAIAYLSKKENAFYLVRDRLGIKPLYYYQHENELCFASEIKPLFSLGIKPELASNLVADYFAFKYCPEDTTLFKRIKKVKPGHFIKFDLNNGSIEQKRYWEPTTHKYDGISYSEAQTELESLMNDAVQLRLIADVPVGNFLSGGIDSSLIAYYIKDNKNISHFCAKKSDEDIQKEGTTSDYYFAQKLASEWNLDFKSIPIGKEQLTLNVIDNIVNYNTDIIADGSLIPSYMINKEASKYGKVVLSGMGADELFYGYAGHQLNKIDHYFDALPKGAQNMVTKMFLNIKPGQGSFKAYKRYLYKFARYQKHPSIKQALYTIVGDFDNSLSVLNQTQNDVEARIDKYFNTKEPIWKQIEHFERENFLVKNLIYMDQMSMANSIENRVPFLDHRIAEFAYNIPESYKISNSLKTKRIVKDIAKHKVPDYILNRRKAGFGMPLRSIFSDKEHINQLLDNDFIESLGLFNLKNIESIIKNHINGAEDNSSIIFALIMFQQWHKKYIN